MCGCGKKKTVTVKGEVAPTAIPKPAAVNHKAIRTNPKPEVKVLNGYHVTTKTK